MAGSGIGDSGGPVANINVTPLVDVMLVLLVIFMVTAPMLQQGVEVNLPKATNAPLKGTAEQVVVSLDREGKIFLGAGNAIELTELSPKVKAIMGQRPAEEQKIYIKADTNLEYGRIMEVMSALHESGITQIGLVSGVRPPGAAVTTTTSARTAAGATSPDSASSTTPKARR